MDAQKVPESVPVDDIDTKPSTAPESTHSDGPTITEGECLLNFQQYLKQKSDLSKFYTDEDLKKHAATAKAMVENLFTMKCKKEVAIALSTLVLYDIAMLLDDSPSIKNEQNGERIDTLKATLGAITSVYDLANPKGIPSIKFLNAKAGLKNIRNKNWKKHFKTREYTGVTRIGSALKTKILDPLVWSASGMQKPLLVMIITDGDVEGEREGLLADIIEDTIQRLATDDKRGKHAVAFHFSQVGNDRGATNLLETLDNSKSIGTYVDCLPVKSSLEKLRDPQDRYRWTVMPKLLLGAIREEWDDMDDVVDVAISGNHEVGGVEEEEDIEGGDTDDDSDDE